jgi:hypothetical protein
VARQTVRWPAQLPVPPSIRQVTEYNFGLYLMMIKDGVLVWQPGWPKTREDLNRKARAEEEVSAREYLEHKKANDLAKEEEEMMKEDFQWAAEADAAAEKAREAEKKVDAAEEKEREAEQRVDAAD